MFRGSRNAFSSCLLFLPHRKEVELHRGLGMVADFFFFTFPSNRLYCLLCRYRLHLCLLLDCIVLFLIRGNLFFLGFGCIGSVILHKVAIQIAFQILRQQLGDSVHPALVCKDERRLAVRICSTLHPCCYKRLTVRGYHRLPPMGVHADVTPVLTAHRLEALTDLAESLCVWVERLVIAGVFLQDDQV